jgi:hypothetical protein
MIKNCSKWTAGDIDAEKYDLLEHKLPISFITFTTVHEKISKLVPDFV